MEETIVGIVVDDYVIHDDPADKGQTVQGSPEVWLKQLATTGDGYSDVTSATVGNATIGAIDMGEVGVLASVPRKNAHLWKPGQSGNPSGKSKADVALIRAIADEFQPAEVVMMVRSAWESAVARNSPRAKLEIAEFIADRIAGKPKQFVSMTKGSPGEWLQALAQVQLPDTEDTEAE
jgi:hypothetical protein